MNHTTTRSTDAGRIGWFPITAITTAAALALALSACGGGGDGSSSTAASGSGLSTYSGTVSGLGSIVVNGVRFSTSGAETADGDDPSKPYTKAFALGTTVTVTGTVDDSTGTGTATSIVVHGGVRGLVTSVGSNTFTVGGQVINVDNTTVYDDDTADSSSFNFAAIVANTTYVEVYGVLDAATGAMTATRVELKDSSVVASEGFAVRGLVTNLDATGHTFDLTIRTGVIAHVTFTDNTVLPTGTTLANALGARVILSGTDAAALASATTGTINVTATKVIVKKEKQNNGVKTAMVGAIKTISSDRKTWTIGDATIDVSQSPELEGVDLATITVGTVVKVKGSFSNGVLVAKEIATKTFDDVHAGGVKLFGMVSGSTAASGSTPASFVVQGVTITIASTSSLSLPADGAYVEVKAHNVSGVLTADEIKTQHDVSTTPRSFEVYGVAPCPTGTAADFKATNGFTLTLRDHHTATVLGASATVDVDSHVTSGSTADATKVCVVEVKGTMDATAARTIDATQIEVKARGTTGSRSVSLR